MATRRRHIFLVLHLVWYTFAVSLIITIVSASHADIIRDGSLGTNTTLISGSNYTILPDHGKQLGGNLFHSFGTFNIGTGETATFTSPATVTNIISRVTGGSPSTIDGQIRSMLIDGTTYSSANLYILNPSGVMCGPNASLDIGGSFHVSTADYLKFSDDSQFNANISAPPVLTAADPVAFGFLSGNPAGISLDRTSLMVLPGQTLSIIGGDINAVGDPDSFTAIFAQGGRINLVSVASAGEVVLNAPDLGMASFARLGNISLTSGVNLFLDGVDNVNDPAGTVVIRGGQILFSGGGIYASGNPGGTIDIKGESLHLDTSFFYADTNGAVDHPGSAYRIDLTGDLLMTSGSAFESSSYGPGRAGDIRIHAAGTVKLGDDTPGTGPFVDFGYYGSIASTANGPGRGGDIYVTTGNLLVQNGFFLNTAAVDQGNAGNIHVFADTVQCLDQGNIGSNAISSGKGGIVEVVAKSILLSDSNDAAVTNSYQSTGIVAQTDGASDGGMLKVTADTIQLLDGGKIDTILFGTGHAADIEVTAKNILVSGFANAGGTPIMSAIDARLYGAAATGTGGNISITTDYLRISDGGAIRTALFLDAPGNSGNITVNSKTIDIANRGQIYADSFRGGGNSGDITVNATSMTISGAKYVPLPELLDFDFTGLSTTTNTGRGGAIIATLTGDLKLTSGGGIKADTQGTGTGGAINVSARNFMLTDAATINASSTGTGNAGDIGIQTGALKVETGATITTQAQDTGAGGTVTVAALKADLASSGQISSSASGAGNAGNIAMALAGDLTVSGGAAISADTKGVGGGGSINLKSANLALYDSGQITSAASGAGNAGKITVALTGDLSATSGGSINADTKGAGAGGAVSIEAGNILLSDRASLGAASSGTGNAGYIGIRTGNMRIEKGAVISTRAQDKGAGGTITLNTANLKIADSGQISSTSSNAGNAGDIVITSADSLNMRNASITTESLKADGGNISISAPNRINIVDSKVTASVDGGKSTTGGNISIDPEYLIVRNGQIVANAYEGTGGNIKIVANTFLTDALTIVDASSALGISGAVDILAPNNNVSGLISPLSSEFVSASALLRERCIARIREGKYSSFVVGGRDGLPIEPGNLLPSIPY